MPRSNIAASQPNTTIVDNDTTFKGKDTIDDEALNGGGLLLSPHRTRKLLKNWHATHHIKSKPHTHHFHANPGSRNHAHSRNQNYGYAKRGCYFCGEQNHQKHNCRHGRPVTCYSCGKFGHKQFMDLCNN